MRDELATRWAREPWLSLGPLVHHLLVKGRRLDRLEISRHDGRIDLRGLPFPRRGRWGAFPWLPELQPASADLPVMHGLRAPFKGPKLEGVDLSFADLEDTLWESCTFKDVIARSANLSNCVFSDSLFEDVDFTGANLFCSVLGGFTGYETNTFRRVNFTRADLRQTVYRFPLFEGCDFSGAKFANVDFGASRFVRCRFVGKLKGAEFRGSWEMRYHLGQEREYFDKRRIMPADIKNKMLDVDFSHADLNGVTFWGVDLSNCKLPSDDRHVIVRDPRSFYERVKAVLATEWSGSQREETLDILDMLIGPGDRFAKKLEVTQRAKHGEAETARLFHEERVRLDRPWHWRATRPVVLTRGFFETKSRPWGGALFDLLLRLSKET